MDIVVKGRHAEVSRKFKEHATEKLLKVERLDHRIIRLEVEVSEERNPRQSHSRERVEVTCVSKGPIVRAEAAAADPFAALDLVIDKLEARLRKAADKRRVHHGARNPESLQSTLAAPADLPVEAEASSGSAVDDEVGGVVVREKRVETASMTLDEALFQMELLGHDFFLFPDADTGLASVAYRRQGYDYGVIRLASGSASASNGSTATRETE
ncbi:MAG TPA: ribosome-associated translation inhibitor RaiA [Mycobacteriales bacterium]|nr:ribosome-associated translation inhibitor RaiA [Mycobacteriales bacterium]